MSDSVTFTGRNAPETTEMPPPPKAVQVENLHFSYNDSEETLSGVSLSVEQGDFLAVIGPNGGGKSTLLRLLLGLGRPSHGSVRIFGTPPALMSSHIGYVPQFSTLQSDFPASVLDMTLMGGARPRPWGGGWRTDRAARTQALAYLEVLGLADYAHVPVRALSGGQRQRALVARALMGRPDAPCGPLPAKTARREGGANSAQTASPNTARAPLCADPFLLLLDEPTASIDPGGKFCFYEFIGQLRGKVTVIVVSHDMFMSSPFFTHIVFMNRTLTPLPGKTLTPDMVTTLFGAHLHECPVADLQHASSLRHEIGCSHPACRSTAETCEKRNDGPV